MSKHDEYSLVPRSVQAQQIDTVDKQLLNEIQWVFPLTDRPYLEISKRYNISEKEVITI
jgi:DNA-binding Lrp family transcriptional regulator